ncbi:putative MafB-related protein [Neisseria gonorrhoeae]|uniref:Putative MafB-related protein n=1 Tax=Neisseria gonorrhoeae TaxID=485 RepID=A0A378W097_NEIGO|nr:putative MafB-related protein [Neisseria gonorrhoeae]
MLTQGVGDGFKRATRYSPELDRSGNAAEAFNGTADIVKTSSARQEKLSAQAMPCRV